MILSAGGTGGHIFPAIAIANYLKQKNPDIEILFIGAQGRMEMEKVPNAGYKIIGLPIAGFQRKWKWSNLLLPFKILVSFSKAFSVVRSFKPDIVVGFGGYASGPVLYISSLLGKPTIIQEQNSYAGVTNKILSKRAKAICVAYSDMERFFPREKIKLTGNPVRKDLMELNVNKEDAVKFFGLNQDKKTILVIGGSLGARTINESIEKGLEEFGKNNLQLIWQTGKAFYSRAKEAAEPYSDHVKVFDFINRMNFAYTAADIVISRAGALSISELTLVRKAAVLVPSPNVAEDHQTKNAMALVNKNAAIMVTDAESKNKLISTVIDLLKDENKLQALRDNVGTLSFKDADARITDEILIRAK